MAPGGLMVYSTCSMNPIENEAVVVQLLQTFRDQIELVDISEKLPGLKTQPGLTDWCVMAKNKEVYRSVADVPSDLQSLLRPNMFPPSKEILDQVHLERWSDASLWIDSLLNFVFSIRLLPHHQNTGAFFVALFQKIDRSATNGTESEASSTVAKRPAEEVTFNEEK